MNTGKDDVSSNSGIRDTQQDTLSGWGSEARLLERLEAMSMERERQVQWERRLRYAVRRFSEHGRLVDELCSYPWDHEWFTRQRNPKALTGLEAVLEFKREARFLRLTRELNLYRFYHPGPSPEKSRNSLVSAQFHGLFGKRLRRLQRSARGRTHLRESLANEANGSWAFTDSDSVE